MKIIIVLVILLTFRGTGYAEEGYMKWSTTDTAMQITYTALHIIDWGQTRHITTASDEVKLYKYTETNPILGPRPTIREVNVYFITTLVMHTAVSHYLPAIVKACGGSDNAAKYSRTIWQSLTIGLEGNMVRRNARLGIKIDF